MFRVLKNFFVALLIFVFVFAPVSLDKSFIGFVYAQINENAWQDYENYVVIDKDTTWSGQVSYVDFNKPVIVVNGATLTIQKGTQITIATLLVYDGKVLANGTSDQKIVFTKAEMDTSQFPAGYDPKCFMRTGGMIEFSDMVENENEEPSVFDFVDFDLMGTDLRYDSDNCPAMAVNLKPKNSFFNSALASEQRKTNPALMFYSGRAKIQNSTFKNNLYSDIEAEIYNYEGDPTSYLEISNSNFETNSQNTAVISLAKRFDFDGNEIAGAFAVRLINNWYGSPNGPQVNSDFPTGGEIISGDYTLEGFSTQRFSDVCETCASNVFFLPGIKSSRLYKDGILGTEDKLWPPNYFGNDLAELALDENGKSINKVYTRDVLDEVGIPIIGGNIYKSFIENLNSLKTSGEINDFNLFAYDWRLDAEVIVSDGANYPNGEIKSAVGQILALAQSSKNKKVTIIAHSNGGLLAKAIMLELEKTGQTDKISKIVLLASPQIGTPLATLSMLYGYDESALLGTLISRKDSRQLLENMSGAYNLLPSEKYFEALEKPFIDFSATKSENKIFTNAYGENIDSWQEFSDFLLAKKDARAKPKKDELEKENVLNEKLIAKTQETHQRLDNWNPPENIEVIEIAGWGLDTISGINYSEKEKTKCYGSNSKIPVCSGTGEYEPIYEPQFTVDGDEVVVAPSALMLAEKTNVKRYWVDLYNYNDTTIFNRGHKDILESDPAINFISSIIVNKNDQTLLPEFIKTSRPNDYKDAKPRIRMSLYSPLDIHFYDELGNHTGPKKVMLNGVEQTVFETAIPNSYYYQFGQRKYVGVPSGEKIRVEMEGYDSGSYTLKMEEIKLTETSEEKISDLTFSNLPVLLGSKVLLEIPKEGLANLEKLTADYDADGKIDYSVKPVLNGIATLDITPPEAQIKFNLQTRKIEILGIDEQGKTAISNFPFYSQISDEMGNILQLNFSKKHYENKNTQKIIESLLYNGQKTELQNVSISYSWDINKKMGYNSFTAYLQNGSQYLQSQFYPRKNLTNIVLGNIGFEKGENEDEREKGKYEEENDDAENEKNISREEFPGLIVPSLQTEKGKILIKY